MPIELVSCVIMYACITCPLQRYGYEGCGSNKTNFDDMCIYTYIYIYITPNDILKSRVQPTFTQLLIYQYIQNIIDNSDLDNFISHVK